MDSSLYEYYDNSGLEGGNGAGRGYVKISLMDEWDPEGFVKFEIDLPNIDTYKENG